MQSIKKVLFLGLTAAIVLGCKPAGLNKAITKKITTNFFKNQFTGLLVYSPKTNDTVFCYNADKYFIPASNVKIVTLYTALNNLSDSIPAFKYSIEKDTISILGTGDPTFLHPYFQDSTALNKAMAYAKIKLLVNNFRDNKFGPGWAWEDYDTYFSPERSSFPMHGNVLTITNTNGKLSCNPSVLQGNVSVGDNPNRRHYSSNHFFYNTTVNKTIEVPYIISKALIEELWQDLLPNKVVVAPYNDEDLEKIAYSVPSDSLYKRMMLVSDNFLAEQLLIVTASVTSNTLSSKHVINTMLKTDLADLKQKPRWVDGSGLSRYNLFTPTSFVQVLHKLYKQIPRERLYTLFPVMATSGALTEYSNNNAKPYIYAKSGTLSNNYALSGYLITRSGETLIFSFMNNHYTKPTTAVKKNVQSVLKWLYDNY